MVDASPDAVSLSKPITVVRYETRLGNLLNDGTFKIVWLGNGYAVSRIKDGHIMTQVAPNIPLAEKDLRNLYAMRV